MKTFRAIAKRSNFRIRALFALFLLTETLNISLADERETVIRGYVMPLTWRGRKQVETVAIRVITSVVDSSRKGKDSEKLKIEDYRVANNQKGEELLNLDMVGEEVEATGIVIRKQNDALIINVTDYKVVRESDPKKRK